MNLMEYKARELFAEAGLPVPTGFTVDSIEELEQMEIPIPAVVKAQVETGGRGKLGGVKLADTREEAIAHAKNILGMDIKGHIVKKLMIVKKTEIKSEMYLSVMLDRNTKHHIIIFSPCGGMDIEQTAKTAPEKIFKMPIDPLLGYLPEDGYYLGSKAGLTFPQCKQLSKIIAQLYALCKKRYCTLTEINPLVVNDEDNLVAIDAKVVIDDSGVAFQPDLMELKKESMTEELVKEADSFNFLYIPCDPEGDVVVMSNGSGMLMSCIDHLARKGRKVAAVLDLGGGATSDRIRHAVRILFSTPGAKQLFINIFGGITRCDEVAGGIHLAVTEDGVTHPVVVRFEGTNKDKGLEIIHDLTNVIYADGLISGVDAIVNGGAQ